MKLTTGAKMFLLFLTIIPILLVGLLVVDFEKTTSATVVRKTEKQVKFNDLYKFVKKNKEWYPFTHGLLEFYK